MSGNDYCDSCQSFKSYKESSTPCSTQVKDVFELLTIVSIKLLQD